MVDVRHDGRRGCRKLPEKIVERGVPVDRGWTAWSSPVLQGRGRLAPGEDVFRGREIAERTRFEIRTRCGAPKPVSVAGEDAQERCHPGDRLQHGPGRRAPAPRQVVFTEEIGENSPHFGCASDYGQELVVGPESSSTNGLGRSLRTGTSRTYCSSIHNRRSSSKVSVKESRSCSLLIWGNF